MCKVNKDTLVACVSHNDLEKGLQSLFPHFRVQIKSTKDLLSIHLGANLNFILPVDNQLTFSDLVREVRKGLTQNGT